MLTMSSIRARSNGIYYYHTYLYDSEGDRERVHISLRTKDEREAEKKKQKWDFFVEQAPKRSGVNKEAFEEEKSGKAKPSPEKILTKGSTTNNQKVKEAFKSIQNYQCEKCGLVGTWMGEDITLELDHINGDGSDNRPENLRFLCPNCHSQTNTYRAKNIGGNKVEEKEYVAALNNNSNIRQALIDLGLKPSGNNYKRAYKLKARHDIE